MFEIREVDLAGRIGRLHTKSGTIETPAFFPVIDILRQEVPLESIRRLGFTQIITNAYLLLRRFGDKVAEQGVHRFLGWDGVVMTDSGAYQILEYGAVEATQDEIIEYQVRIGSDISVILDIPTGDTDRATAERSVRETLRRARDALRMIRGTRNLWVLPIQGGKYLDLVELSARESRGLEGYSVYAVGSPTVFLERYEYDTVLRIALAAKKNLPPGRPVHLFGAGHPLIIPYAVAIGVDMFDSASYILYARDGRVFTDYGVERVERLSYLPCQCSECDRSAEEILEMPPEERTRVLALHNLCMIRRYIDMTRQAIREGRLWELLEALSKHHPSTYDSLALLAGEAGYFQQFAPRVKGVVRGVRGYDRLSVSNPRIQYYRRRILGFEYEPKVPPSATIVLAPLPGDPGECSPERGAESGVYIIYYHPLLVAVPQELCGAFPTIHTHIPRMLADDRLTTSMAEELVAYAVKLAEKVGAERVVVGVESDPWGAAERIRERLHHGKDSYM